MGNLGLGYHVDQSGCSQKGNNCNVGNFPNDTLLIVVDLASETYCGGKLGWLGTERSFIGELLRMQATWHLSHAGPKRRRQSVIIASSRGRVAPG